jgi:two-component system OmpR family sensor kinase
MSNSEKRSLFRFLAIYLSSTMLLFSLTTTILYHYQKHNIIDRQIDKLQLKAEKIIQNLRILHTTFNKPLIYPNYKPFQSAIYDINKKYIFGSFKPEIILWNRKFYIQNNNLFYIYNMKPYYLGSAYLVSSIKIDSKPIKKLKKNSKYIFDYCIYIFYFIGFFLRKTFCSTNERSYK